MTLHSVLPFLIGLGGLGMACNIASALSFNSGILFMLIACLIWMRRQLTH